MCTHCAEQLIDAAIAEGRIDASARDTFVRAYESAPELVTETLEAAQPDVLRAGRNYSVSLGQADDEAYKREFAERHGVPLSQVV